MKSQIKTMLLAGLLTCLFGPIAFPAYGEASGKSDETLPRVGSKLTAAGTVVEFHDIPF